MSIADKLSKSKNALVYLLDFANSKTGNDDPDIGEAIHTLCNGYGQDGGDSTIYTSSNGLPYTSTMVIAVGAGTSTGVKLDYVLDAYGDMPNLVDLTLTGYIRRSSSSGTITGKRFSAYPNLKRLAIIPVETFDESGVAKYTEIRFGHYTFAGTNLRELVIGCVGQSYCSASNGYYRNDLPVPPGTSSYNVGSPDGLRLVVYADRLLDKGGFLDNLAPNTTYECYDWQTGDRLI